MKGDTSLGCCGLMEIHGLHSQDEKHARVLVQKMLDQTDDIYQHGLFYWTDSKDHPERGSYEYKHGLLLAKALEGCGQIQNVRAVRNPNSGNNIRMWILRVNWKRMSKFYKVNMDAVNGYEEENHPDND